MHKPTWKRMGLGFLQHFSAFIMCVAAAAVVFNSYVAVNYMNGETAYYNVEPFQAEKEFEDSDLFNSIMKKEVQDIIEISKQKTNLDGSVIVRKSGTEPVIKVRVEGQDAQYVSNIARQIVETLEKYKD